MLPQDHLLPDAILVPSGVKLGRCADNINAALFMLAYESTGVALRLFRLRDFVTLLCCSLMYSTCSRTTSWKGIDN